MGWLAVLCGGCSAPAASSAPTESIAAAPNAVIGGSAAPECAWPSVVFLPGSACSGVLVHPTIMLTAAHCAPRAGQSVSFGEGPPWAFHVRTTKCVAGPGRAASTVQGDWAYCVLSEDERLTMMPLAAPLHGIEGRGLLHEGQRLTAVGFGNSASEEQDIGIKRVAEVVVQGFGDGILEVGDEQNGLCHGDSGGPIFWQDGGSSGRWRLLGTVSGGVGADCAGASSVVTLDHVLTEIEAAEGLDTTPCTSDAGEWAPGPSCASVPVELGEREGSWPTCIAGPGAGPPNDRAPLSASCQLAPAGHNRAIRGLWLGIGMLGLRRLRRRNVEARAKPLLSS